MIVRNVAAVSGALALMISMCISQPLLAGDAQTANKPKDMVILNTDTSVCFSSAGSPYYDYSFRVMDDVTLQPFVIPAGYKFIVTSVDASSTSAARVQVYNPNTGSYRPVAASGVITDTAIAPGMKLCGSNVLAIKGHLEKDIP